MMQGWIEDRIRDVAGAEPRGFRGLSGGCIGDVYRVTLSDGRNLVAKVGDDGSGLALEGFMLRYLAAAGLPVPEVLDADDRLLLMTYLEAGDPIDASAQAHAAELLARLHSISAPAYGFERDTVIGSLHQPNPEEGSWLAFFRDHRLLYMAGEAERAGRLPGRLRARVETLAARLPEWIDKPEAPSLIHGDMWSGNVLCLDGRIAGFIDPAIYFADPEIELAFSTLFGTFGGPFFERYRELRPLKPGFFEARRDLYNLYPLLVHVRLFGGSYVGSVEGILRKFGA